MKNNLLLLILAALVLSACGEDEASGPAERATAVTATEVRSQTVERTELAVGRLRAITAPAVSAETAGRIARIHADVGDEVEAGDVLAEIDPEVQRIAVNSARAERARLEALLANQQRQVQRLERLAAQQSVAEDRLDEAETQLESIQAQLEAAQARLEDAEYNLGQTRITSPVSGIVQARLVSVGDYVSPGARVYELVATGALRAFLPLPEHLQ
ncbi:MAG TPA: efflux RND transporter periplasmic adaptor subunit, partial [Wenzhouxiangella sp.]|nr:efflux RND transporter periplasmic adaptor subunit [Wenzhouxiangella sp.]